MVSSSDKADLTSKSALHQLLSPDGYYQYLQITKPPPHETRASPLTSKDTKSTTSNTTSPSASSLDKTAIEKNYRRLSRKHHPDRPNGDAETFRLLERAKTVLMSDALRKEYDLLGLDLEEEDSTTMQQEEDGGDAGNGGGAGGDSGGGGGDGDAKKDANSGPDTIVSHMASATVAAIMQLAVRTAMMTVASTLVARYKLLTAPAILFLLYTSYQIKKASTTHVDISIYDILSPTLVAFGVLLMNLGRGETYTWSWTFWLGEVTVMTLFALNTLNQSESPIALKPSLLLGMGAFVVFTIACLWIRGKFWRYALLLAIEFGVALLAIVVFPIIEMLVEELMNEKLKKVGEKVRIYGKAIEEIHRVQLEEALSRANSNSGSGGGGHGGGDLGASAGTGGGGVRLRYNNSGGEID